jgi:hypothetical protein
VPPFNEDWEADPAPLAVAELRRLIADPGSSQPPPSSLTSTTAPNIRLRGGRHDKHQHGTPGLRSGGGQVPA